MAFQAGRGKGFLKLVSLLEMSDFPSIRLQSANLPLLNIQKDFGFNQVISEDAKTDGSSRGAFCQIS